MACRLDGTKSLSEPMMEYCLLNPGKHISMTFSSKFINFHIRKCDWKCLWKIAASLSQPRCVKPFYQYALHLQLLQKFKPIVNSDIKVPAEQYIKVIQVVFNNKFNKYLGTVPLALQYLFKYMVSHFVDFVNFKLWNTPTIFTYIE